MKYTRITTSKHDKDSFIAVIPETFSQTTSFGAIELFHPYGFASRPLDSDANGACGALHMEDGAQGYTVLLNDGRIQALLPEVKPGESFMYGPTGQFIRCGQDGSISLFTTSDATTNGRSVYLRLDKDGLTFNFPYGKLNFDATGFHVVHSSGARIDLGAMQAPAPLNVIPAMSWAKLSASIVQVEGSAVHVGTANPLAGAPQPVALATSVLTLCAALNSVLTALGAPATGIVSSSGTATVGPAVVTAIAAANAALAQASALAGPLAVASATSTATGNL